MSEFWGHFNYFSAIALLLFGLYAMMTENNLIRKVIGMVILQTGVILFYISVAFKHGASIPIVPHGGHHGTLDPAQYANPLPQALMLTAIVVGVATLGVALVLVVSIYRTHKTIEEDEVLEKIGEGN